MAMVVNCNGEECILCGICALECPNHAISEGEESFVIDPERCTECRDYFEEPRCVAICPMGCVGPDPQDREGCGAPWDNDKAIAW